jgi:hypothetical protein
VKAILLGLALAAVVTVGIVACGGAPAPRSPARYDAMTEITQLWTQIRDWRREAGLRVEPSAESIVQMKNRPLDDAMRSCPEGHPVTKACEDVCSLSDAICENADQICKIADQLGKDDHQAQEKCTSAKASCKEAKQRCCTKCSEEPKP